MNDIDFFAINDGPFNTRLHVINHVDMILGLTPSEEKIENKSRVLVFIDHDTNQYDLYNYGDISKEEMVKIRQKILKESLFATKWEQLIPAYENENVVRFEDLEGDDDIDYVIDSSIEAWMRQDGVFPEDESEPENFSAFFDKTSFAVILLDWPYIVADRIVVSKVPTQEEIDDMPVTINSRRVLATKYESDDSWKTFSERICKNDFVKQYLNTSQNGICPVCHGELGEKYVVHHIDYDHKCKFFNSGLEWRMPKTRVQPNCELCYKKHREWFDECTSRLKAVHNNCNYFVDRIS